VRSEKAKPTAPMTETVTPKAPEVADLSAAERMRAAEKAAAAAADNAGEAKQDVREASAAPDPAPVPAPAPVPVTPLPPPEIFVPEASVPIAAVATGAGFAATAGAGVAGVAPAGAASVAPPGVAAVGAASVAAATATAGVAAAGASVFDQVSDTPDAAAEQAKSSRKRQKPRKARLRVAKLDPWSVMKTSFLFSIAFGIITFVTVWVTWRVIETSTLFDSLNESVSAIVTNSNDATPWRIQSYVSGEQVIGAAALISVVNVLLLTALGTLAAFLYNLASNIIGGIEVTLADH
jgi:hypothetical protein